MAVIEDQSRRTNIRLRGTAESVSVEELSEYIKGLCGKIVKNCEESAWELDRVHRLPRPQYLSVDKPRDVIAKFHYPKSKELLLQSARKEPSLPAPYKDVLIFADLSLLTIARRREFAEFMKVLRDQKISYRCGYPTKLLIWGNGALHVIKEPEEARNKLKEWGMLTTQNGNSNKAEKKL
ncbi:Hypothetical predicted protein [Pelobates cultripes]|uniref:Uncharacterized protein n=1 Tax=Pelobates cultripes TaxID=61616 RepID=A0AAD1VLE7_PELCU|nr:Hypothetical predicted protein [Pelobates cultripes]